MTPLLPQFQIIEETETRLVCYKTRGLLSNLFLMFCMAFFGGIPLGLLVLISSEYGIMTLSCDRIESQLVDCRLSQSEYLGFVERVKDKPVDSVVDAQFKSAEWLNGEGGGTRKVWVSLITQSGSERLFETQYAIESGSTPSFHVEFIATFKSFIDSQESSFYFQEDTRFSGGFWGGVPLFLLYPLVAVFVIYIAMRSQTIIFDKEHDRYIRRIKTVLGTRTKTYSLGDISSIQVKEFRTRRFGKQYQLTIAVHTGKAYKFPGIRNPKCVREIADRMQTFLGLVEY